MVFEHQDEHPSQWAAICSIATKFGISHETLRNCVRRAETDDGRRPGLTSDERERDLPAGLPAALPCHGSWAGGVMARR
jgi:transposase-like protein